jgi:hypothetical protein
LRGAVARVAWVVGPVLVACGGAAGTSSSSSSPAGTGGSLATGSTATGGSSSSSAGTAGAAAGGGGAGGIVVAPAVALTWEDETAAAGLAGLSTQCRTVSFGDLDGDGAPDLVLPDAGSIRIFRNDGAGHFALWATVPAPELPKTQMICATAIADPDGDGRRDVVVGVDRAAPLATGVVVLFNDGGGAFTRASASQVQGGFSIPDGGYTNFSVFSVGVIQSAGQAPVILLANELDGAAGMIDTTTCTYDAQGVNVECPTAIAAPVTTAFRVPLGTRTLEAVSGAGLTLTGNAQGLGIVDVDGDGNDDVLVAMDFQAQRALRSQGGTFTDVSSAWGIDHFAHGMGVALGDVDGDGVTDAVFTTIGGFIDYQGHAGAGFTRRGAARRPPTRRSGAASGPGRPSWSTSTPTVTSTSCPSTSSPATRPIRSSGCR